MVWQGKLTLMKIFPSEKGYNKVYIGIKALGDQNLKLSKLNFHEISKTILPYFDGFYMSVQAHLTTTQVPRELHHNLSA